MRWPLRRACPKRWSHSDLLRKNGCTPSIAAHLPSSTPRSTKASGCRSWKQWPAERRSSLHTLPEVLGGAGVLLDPRDVAAWRDAIIRVVNDETLRDDLRARGLARAATFTWQRTARLTLEAYREVVGAA